MSRLEKKETFKKKRRKKRKKEQRKKEQRKEQDERLTRFHRRFSRAAASLMKKEMNSAKLCVQAKKGKKNTSRMSCLANSSSFHLDIGWFRRVSWKASEGPQRLRRKRKKRKKREKNKEKPSKTLANALGYGKLSFSSRDPFLTRKSFAPSKKVFPAINPFNTREIFPNSVRSHRNE
jgi:hypothetical protein